MNLLVEIDGQQHRLRDCFWVRYAPSGCAIGSCLGDCATTSEQAHAEFTTRQRDRDRETRQGYRHELVARDFWRANIQPCFLGKCEHRTSTA